jgi:hypothetical protein
MEYVIKVKKKKKNAHTEPLGFLKTTSGAYILQMLHAVHNKKLV